LNEVTRTRILEAGAVTEGGHGKGDDRLMSLLPQYVKDMSGEEMAVHEGAPPALGEPVDDSVFFAPYSRTVVGVAEKVSPAVGHINVIQRGQRKGTGSGPIVMPDEAPT
jgi:hypothetical protein